MEQLIKEVKHKSAEYSQNFNAINVFFRQLNNNTEFGMIIDCNNLHFNFIFLAMGFRRIPAILKKDNYTLDNMMNSNLTPCKYDKKYNLAK